MSKYKKLECQNLLGNAIRLLASKSALGKDAQIAARKWIEEAQEKARIAGLIRTLGLGGTYKSVNNLVEKLRDA